MTNELVAPERTRAQIADEVRGKVKKALSKLGNTSDEVAQTLLNEECRGYPNKSLNCPINVYLTRHVKTQDTLSLWTGGTHLGIGVWPAEGGHAFHMAVDFPSPVVQFVSMFDGGEYPELDMDVYLEDFMSQNLVEPPVIVVDPDPLTSELEAIAV